MTGGTRRHETRHYPANDPATPERAAHDVGVVLGSWQLSAPAVTALVARARTLAAETIAAYGGERIAVTVARGEDVATVHVLSVVCLQQHPDGLIDPATANVLREAAERWGAATQQPCLCTSFALLGDDWKNRRLFIAPRPSP